MNATPQSAPSLKNIKNFCDNYAKTIDDLQGTKDFKICESAEAVASLRAELAAVANNTVSIAILDAIIGKKRPAKHGSYEAWAKMMLLWLATNNG